MYYRRQSIIDTYYKTKWLFFYLFEINSEMAEWISTWFSLMDNKLTKEAIICIINSYLLIFKKFYDDEMTVAPPSV